MSCVVVFNMMCFPIDAFRCVLARLAKVRHSVACSPQEVVFLFRFSDCGFLFVTPMSFAFTRILFSLA